MDLEDANRSAPLVLVVDDDTTTRLLAKQALSRDGLRVAEAPDGASALEIFATSEVDLILLDVEMPGRNGFDVCEAVRGGSTAPEVPIIMMTGLDDLDAIAHAFDVGATDFVTKPVNWLILGQRIGYVLRASRGFDELRRNQERLAEAQEIAQLGNWEYSTEGDRLVCSERTARILHLDATQGVPAVTALTQRIVAEDRARVFDQTRAALETNAPFSVDFRIQLSDDSFRVIHSHAKRKEGLRGAAPRLQGIVQDITERVEAQERIRFMAFHDNLTGLGNQRLFRDRLNGALDQARRYERMVAILFIDLDDFKRINDTLGHAAGDLVLKEAGDRLQHSVRTSDSVSRPAKEGYTGSVSRLGGDEFTVLLTEISDAQDTVHVARRIRDALSHPMTVEGDTVVVGASIGISVSPTDGEDAELLLTNADAAMYHAKELGGKNYQFYTSSMNAESLKRLKLENELRRALEANAVVPHYQPRVDIGTGRVIGMEALARWMDPQVGVVSPGVFIPLAEQSGLILPLGESMLKAACAETLALRQVGFENLIVSVNLSPRQLSTPGIAQQIMHILDAIGLESSQLELEITENALIRNEEEAGRALAQLKENGIRIALDDFGIGYSSMTYLKQFPVDTVKIDRSFVSGLGTSQEDSAIVTAIVSMCQALSLTTVAEGVETEIQRDLLRELGCDELQGYLVSPALPAEEFHQFIDGHTRPEVKEHDR